jgi:hypothetical protein
MAGDRPSLIAARAVTRRRSTIGPVTDAVDVILREPGDLLRFPTAEEAALEMEPIDVRNGEWTAWETTGRVLRPEIEHRDRGRGILRISVEHVVLHPTDAHDPEGLLDAIGAWLVACRIVAARPATLAEALAAVPRS